MAYCAECGRELAADATFCPACGATVGAPSVMPPLASAPAPLPQPQPSLDVGGIVSGALRQVFAHFGSFLATQGLFVLAGAAVSLWLTLTVVRNAMLGLGAFADVTDPLEMVALVAPVVGWSLAAAMMTALFGLVGTGFGLVVADGTLVGDRMSLGEAWARLRPRFGNYLATALLFSLALMGVVLAGFALFFLVIPVFAGIVLAIYLAVRWAVAMPASIFESREASQNLKRSSELTRGHRGGVFLVFLVAMLISAVPSAIVGAATGSAYGDFDPATGFVLPPVWLQVVQWAATTAIGLVVAFFSSAAIVRVYRSLAPLDIPPAPQEPPPAGTI